MKTVEIIQRPGVTSFVVIACIFLGAAISQADTARVCPEKFHPFTDHSACAAKSPDALDMALTEQEKQEIVDKHNTLRRGVTPVATNMMKMQWDDELAAIAQGWLDTCPVTSGGRISHDHVQQRFIPGRFSVGQNLGVGYSTFAKAIDGWYNEHSDYNYGTKYTTHTKPVGHYTQMVWAKSIKIGCGRIKCYNKVVYSCNYGPAGNVANFDKPYETGPQKGSECKTNDNGLCDCGGLECLNGQKMNINSCTCDCGSQFKPPECSLDCSKGDTSYCGTGAFYTKENCDKALSPFVTSTCPHQCEICPYAEKGYQGDNATTKPGEPNGTDKPGEPNGTDKPGEPDGTDKPGEPDGNGETSTSGEGIEGKDDDDGASTMAASLLLLLVASLVSYFVK